MSYFAIGLMLVVILCLVHLLTTFYEQKEHKQVKPKVESDFWMARQKKKLAKNAVVNKRVISARIKLDIEKKFNQSSMNRTYAFPRNSD